MAQRNLLVRWVEHAWTRMRRLDYWNESIPSHYPHKYYRATSPGSQPPAEVPLSHPENVYNIRYYNRDTRRKDVSYYPDTPLSLNHAIMKGNAQRPTEAPPSQLPAYGSFTGGVSGHAAMMPGRKIEYKDI